MMTKIITLLIAILTLTGCSQQLGSLPVVEDKTIPIIEKPIEETYFAELNKDNEVIRVIVADQAFIDTGKVGNPDNWKQTYKENNVRKNYAGKGYKYNEDLDAFITEKPTLDATLDEATAKWIIPVKEVIINDNLIATTTTATTTTK